MTNPILPLYKAGDVVLLDGQVVTIKSWPATNEGFFAWDRYVAATNPAQESSLVQGTSWYGRTEAGEPLQSAANVQPYSGPAVWTLAAPPVDAADVVVDGLVDESPADVEADAVEPVEDVPAPAVEEPAPAAPAKPGPHHGHQDTEAAA